MQLPFSSKLLGSTLSSEEKQERRQQQLRRLQELNARRREEKLQLDQERLDRLLYVQVRAHPGSGLRPLRKAVPERVLPASSSARRCSDCLSAPWGQEGVEGAECGAPQHRGPVLCTEHQVSLTELCTLASLIHFGLIIFVL